jgi:hypothetical protein
MGRDYRIPTMLLCLMVLSVDEMALEFAGLTAG